MTITRWMMVKHLLGFHTFWVETRPEGYRLRFVGFKCALCSRRMSPYVTAGLPWWSRWRLKSWLSFRGWL